MTVALASKPGRPSFTLRDKLEDRLRLNRMGHGTSGNGTMAAVFRMSAFYGGRVVPMGSDMVGGITCYSHLACCGREKMDEFKAELGVDDPFSLDIRNRTGLPESA